MTVSKSIYPEDGRALVYRQSDRYVFAVNGTGIYPEFIYKFVHAPLDSDALVLGQLAVQSIMGYRKITEAEFLSYQEEWNRLYPDESQLVEQGKLPNVCVWPESSETEVTAMANLEEIARFTIALDSSVEQIGAAILRGFQAIDLHVAEEQRRSTVKRESDRGLTATKSRRAPKKK